MAYAVVVCSTCNRDMPLDGVFSGPNYCSRECEPEYVQRVRRENERELQVIKNRALVLEDERDAARAEVERLRDAVLKAPCPRYDELHRQGLCLDCRRYIQPCWKIRALDGDDESEGN